MCRILLLFSKVVSSILPYPSVELVACSSHGWRRSVLSFSQQGCRWNARSKLPGSLPGSGAVGGQVCPSPSQAVGSVLCHPRAPAWSWPQAASSGCQDLLPLRCNQHTKCAETLQCSHQLLGSGCTIQLDFHTNLRYHLILAAFFFVSRVQLRTECPPDSGGCKGSGSLCRREQWSNTSTAMRGVGGDGKLENLSLPDPSGAASAQAVVTGQNLSTYDLKTYWRVRGWLALCTAECVYLFQIWGERKALQYCHETKPPKKGKQMYFGLSSCGNCEGRNSICCTASASELLEEQTQIFGVLNQ